MRGAGALWVQPAFEPAQVTAATELVAETVTDALQVTVPDGYISVTMVDTGVYVSTQQELSSAVTGASELKVVADGN